jgi:hypothetical protein
MKFSSVPQLTFALYIFIWFSDLVLLHAPAFDTAGNSLSLHVRTKKRFQYSYIEAAAIQIGEDILEVASFGDYAFNRVDTAEMGVASIIGGYPIYYTQMNKKTHRFDVAISPSQNITLSTFKDLVNVRFSGNQGRKIFVESSGIIGSAEGILLARDGTTDMSNDIDAFGQEWQVTYQ